jgi:hypothetical protein
MNIQTRFEKAREIAEPMLLGGNYSWIPKTKLGWVIRIACTDVGQDAWQSATEIEATTIKNDGLLSPQDEVVQLPSGKD